MVQPSILLILGTDTAVGKTWTGCALARALCRAGRRVVAIKPLETGCSAESSEQEDGVALARATGQAEPRRALLRFREPVAPPEAADRERRRIDLEALVGVVREYAAGADLALVEGAGGVLSPLTWERSAIDVGRALAARVLLVAPDRLGTINHTLMALEVLELGGLDVVGVVLTAPERPDASTGSNALAIARVSRGRRIHCVPRATDPQVASRALDEVIPWL